MLYIYIYVYVYIPKIGWFKRQNVQICDFIRRSSSEGNKSQILGFQQLCSLRSAMGPWKPWVRERLWWHRRCFFTTVFSTWVQQGLGHTCKFIFVSMNEGTCKFPPINRFCRSFAKEICPCSFKIGDVRLIPSPAKNRTPGSVCGSIHRCRIGQVWSSSVTAEELKGRDLDGTGGKKLLLGVINRNEYNSLISHACSASYLLGMRYAS